MNKAVMVRVLEKPQLPHNRRSVTMWFYKENNEVDSVELYSDIPEGRAWVSAHAIKTALEAMGYTVQIGEKP